VLADTVDALIRRDSGEEAAALRVPCLSCAHSASATASKVMKNEAKVHIEAETLLGHCTRDGALNR
jgi:hypothetical protein